MYIENDICVVIVVVVCIVGVLFLIEFVWICVLYGDEVLVCVVVIGLCYIDLIVCD